jgi:hypothetical protein
MKKILSILPTQSLIYCLICGAGVIVFIFLIILPSQDISAELDQDIEKINDHIEKQRILRPVFDSLLKRAKVEKSTELPSTQKIKFEHGDINNISELLQEIARRHELKVQDIRTDVGEMMNNSGYMLMHLHVAGDFMNFRGFLMDLGTIPSLEQIEELNIRAIEANREYKLRIWMAQK